MKNMKKPFLVTLVAIVLVAFTAGCAFSAPVRLRVMDQGWDSQKFHNEVARFIVENGFDGYVFDIIVGSATLLWQDMLFGDIDLVIEEWPQNIFNYDAHLAGGYIVELGTVASDSAQGFYVPRFVIEGDPERGIEPMAPTLRAVADLIRYPHVFRDPERPSRGRIYGAIPGWMIDEIMHAKFMFYGLNESFNYFRSGSELVLFGSLESAYNLGEAWVGYLWEPSWPVGRFDMVLLEDAPFDPELYLLGATEIPRQALKTVSSSRFPERAPDLLDFFARFYTGTRRISEALDYMQANRASPQEAAIWFLQTNDYILDEWLEPEQAARVREALASI